MTRFEQIAAAFPLHAQRIAEATFADYELDDDVKGLDWLYGQSECDEDASVILQRAFVWDATEEGHRYWVRLATGYRQ